MNSNITSKNRIHGQLILLDPRSLLYKLLDSPRGYRNSNHEEGQCCGCGSC